MKILTYLGTFVLFLCVIGITVYRFNHPELTETQLFLETIHLAIIACVGAIAAGIGINNS